jgi:hypothetical protein
MAKQAVTSLDESHVAFERLGEDVRETMTGEVSPAAHAAGRERLITVLAGGRAPSTFSGRRRTVPMLIAAALSVAAAAAAAVIVHRSHGEPEVTWRVDPSPNAPGTTARGTLAQGTSAQASVDGYVSVPPAGPPKTVRFGGSADAVVTFAPASEGRIGPVNAHELHVVLESGHAHVRLARGTLSWIIDAGPYAVAATAATMDVAWSPRDASFDVRVSEGRAVVRGPLAADGMTVEPGQRLSAEVTEGRIGVQADGQADVARPPPSRAVDDLPAIEVEDLPLPKGASATTHRSWTERIARGEFDVVLDEASRAGLASSCAQRPLLDLVALADAARYRGQTDVARRALLAERERFASTSDAKTAAFLLGRLAEDADHSPRDALVWYDRYLAEAPQGSFAAEAFGRRMNALVQTSRMPDARSAAQDYLQRYPNGAYASVASDILRAR